MNNNEEIARRETFAAIDRLRAELHELSKPAATNDEYRKAILDLQNHRAELHARIKILELNTVKKDDFPWPAAAGTAIAILFFLYFLYCIQHGIPGLPLFAVNVPRLPVQPRPHVP